MIRKKGALLTVIMITLLLLTSCAGVGDWTSEPLPGGYVVQRANTESVTLCSPEDESYDLTAPVIETFVTEIACNDHYIMVKRKDPIDSFADLKNIFKRDYYIVDVNKHHVLGPYEKNDFEKACTDLNISDIDWKDVDDLERVED